MTGLQPGNPTARIGGGSECVAAAARERLTRGDLVFAHLA